MKSTALEVDASLTPIGRENISTVCPQAKTKSSRVCPSFQRDAVSLVTEEADRFGALSMLGARWHGA